MFCHGNVWCNVCLRQVVKHCKGLPSHIYQAAERIKEIVAKGHNVDAHLRQWFHEYFAVPGMLLCVRHLDLRVWCPHLGIMLARVLARVARQVLIWSPCLVPLHPCRPLPPTRVRTMRL
jgi:hypothetical protein